MAVARAAWRDEAARIDPGRLVFLDETGFDTRLVRTHARAPRGQRAWLADILARIADHLASRLDELLPWHWRRSRAELSAAA